MRSPKAVGDSWQIPRGQKMPNMSTVAVAVTYRPYEIIDILVNMFINVRAYWSVEGRFDQFRGV